MTNTPTQYTVETLVAYALQRVSIVKSTLTGAGFPYKELKAAEAELREALAQLTSQDELAGYRPRRAEAEVAA